jgi:hypothetical protein
MNVDEREPTVDLLRIIYPHATSRPGTWLHQRDSQLVELDDGIVVRLDEVSNRLEQVLHAGRRGVGEGS